MLLFFNYFEIEEKIDFEVLQNWEKVRFWSTSKSNFAVDVYTWRLLGGTLRRAGWTTSTYDSTLEIQNLIIQKMKTASNEKTNIDSLVLVLV